jgi:hypothetical protein
MSEKITARDMFEELTLEEMESTTGGTAAVAVPTTAPVATTNQWYFFTAPEPIPDPVPVVTHQSYYFFGLKK